MRCELYCVLSCVLSCVLCTVPCGAKAVAFLCPVYSCLSRICVLIFTILPGSSRAYGVAALGWYSDGFPAFLEGILSKLNNAWPGFMPNTDKVVANETDVVVFCSCTADGGLSGKAVHQFLVKDELQFSFDIYWDSEYWAQRCKI